MNNDEVQKSSEIKIIKIESKLYERSPTIDCLFSKPKRIKFEEKEKFLIKQTNPTTTNKYERKEQINQIIKLYNQSQETIKTQPEYIHKLVSILKSKRKDYQEKSLEKVYNKSKTKFDDNTNVINFQKSETMPNIYDNLIQKNKKVHFSNNLIESGLQKSVTTLNQLYAQGSAKTLDLFKYKEISDSQEYMTERDKKLDELKYELMENLRLQSSKKNFLSKSSSKNGSSQGFRKINYKSDKINPSMMRNPYDLLKTTTENFKSVEKPKKINSGDKDAPKKMKLVDIYYYDKKKWEDKTPKQEKTLQNILIKKSNISFLHEMLGEWGSKGRSKK